MFQPADILKDDASSKFTVAQVPVDEITKLVNKLD